MEYAYNAVIIGPDLVRRPEGWIARPEEIRDAKLRGLPPHRYLQYALNTYRVLATRGTRFYSTDTLTQNFLQTLIPPHRQ